MQRRDTGLGADDHGAVRVNVLAARGAAVAQRVLAGGKLDEVDRGVLAALRELFLEAVEAVRLVASAGSSGSQPRHFVAVGLALESVPEGDARPVDPERLIEAVRQVAILLTQLEDHQDPGAAEAVLPVLEGLCRMATADAGSTGDLLATF